MGTDTGINGFAIVQTPVAIVDVETTGLYPSGDRIVELSVVRIDPGRSPELVLDTLINPNRRVGATRIHGIRDEDVADAPCFNELPGDFAAAVSGCVIAAYNVYFEEKFLRAEFQRVGVSAFPPHLCLMYLRPLLGLGGRCTLEDACQQNGIKINQAHRSAVDALAGAQLWRRYLEIFSQRGISTFGTLSRGSTYKFFDSFASAPFDSGLAASLPRSSKFKSRHRSIGAAAQVTREDSVSAMGSYWDGLTAVLSDLTVTAEEVDYLRRKRQELGLSAEQIRWLHSRYFSGILAEMSDDMKIDDEEVRTLNLIADALRELGWTPGDIGYLS